MYKLIIALVLMFVFSSCTLPTCYTAFEFKKSDGSIEKFSIKNGEFPKIRTGVLEGGYIVVFIESSDSSERTFVATEMTKETSCVKDK